MAHLGILLSIAAGAFAGFVISRILLTGRILTVNFLIASLCFSVLFSFLFYYGIFYFTLTRLRTYPHKTQLIWIGLCISAGLLLFFVIPVHLPEHIKTLPAYQRLVIWPTLSVIFTGLLLTVSVWLVTHPASSSSRAHTYWWTWMSYAAIMMTGWFFYLLAFYPGVMSPDSLDQWSQMTSNSYRDWHPVFHTLTNWLITRIWFSPAAIVCAQILALGATMGWGFSILQKIGARRSGLYLLAVFAAFTPGNGMMVITLWKDIFFSVAVLALTLIVLEIVNTQGVWLKKWWTVLLLGFVFALTLLYRHNGYLIVPFVIVLLLIFYRHIWRHIILASIISIALLIGVRYFLYRSINVTDYRHAPSTISALNIIAAHFDNGTTMTADELTFLNKVTPLQPGEDSWPYNCYANDDLFFRDRLRFGFILDHEVELWLLAGKLTYRSSRPTLEYLWCNSAYMFQVLRPQDSYYEFGVNTIFPNEFGLQMNSQLPQLREKINVLIAQDAWLWALGRAAFWFYASIFCLSVFAVRHKSPVYFLVLAPSLLSSIPMAFLGGWPAFRYVYPSYLVGILLFGLLFIENPPKSNQDSELSSNMIG